MKKFPFYKQIEAKDCGPTCLKIIAKYYGKILNLQKLSYYSETTREGSNLLKLSDAAENFGFRTIGVKRSAQQLDEVPLPCILHWNKEHYVVLYNNKKGIYYISDPAIGLINYNQEEFLKFWIGNNADATTEEGIALLVEPTPKFHQSEFDKEEKNIFGFALLFKYILPYKSFIIQLIFGLLA